MSTAMISPHPFYDFSDIIKQVTNPKLQVERNLSSPVGLSLRRTCSTNGTQIILASPQKPQSQMSTISREHRKLDRSISEPVDKKQQQQQQQQVQPPNSSRYKTELCRPFEENGTCKYGDKCQFAHGINELRTLARHPKYKTELCRTFHSTGFCPYGPRCHFIHNDEAKKSMMGQNGGQSGGPQNIPSRPKALSLGGLSISGLGSTGELSPPSSNSGSPNSMNSFFVDDSMNLHSPHSPTLYDYQLSGKQLSPGSSVHFQNELNLILDNFGNTVLGQASMDSPNSQDDSYQQEECMTGFLPLSPIQQKCAPMDSRGKLVRLPIFNLLAQ